MPGCGTTDRRGRLNPDAESYGGSNRGNMGAIEATEEAIVNSLITAQPTTGVDGPREPAYRTGGLVRQEADGTLTFLGRRDNQIKRRGYRIELGDIEAAILQHPEVVECAVSAVPDDASGMFLVAHVSAKEGVGPRDIVRFCAERIPKYMVPDRVDMLAGLPKTATAKIDRAGLARSAAEHAGEH